MSFAHIISIFVTSCNKKGGHKVCDLDIDKIISLLVYRLLEKKIRNGYTSGAKK
jgi:hypothetical protein